jgi:nitrogen regulatory protein PII
MEFLKRANVSIVTAILPVAKAAQVIDGLFELGEQNALLFNARGTVIRDRWYQSFMPVISPELEYLQFLVPDPEVDAIIECIVTHGQLQLSSAGAVFSVPCDEVEYGSDFTLWAKVDEAPGINESMGLKENLTAIFCIAQSAQVDAISRAAMNAGAHGPTIFYSEGRGLRDRLGWLKITKKGVKEVIVLIVDNVDKIAVTEAIIEAGKLDLPGRGFLYRMPVQKGLINLPSIVGNRGNSASMQQIVAAIDNIKGSTNWRDESVIELGSAGKGAGLNLFSQIKKRTWLTGQVCLGCIVARKHTDLLLDAMLSAGATGANVSFARFIEAESETTAAGRRLNHESGFVRCILSENNAEKVKEAIKMACVENSISDAFIFIQPVTRAFTYQAPVTVDRVKGGPGVGVH